MRCADSRIILGVMFERSSFVPDPFSVVVIWIYRRTSLFSRGMTITEPELAEWIAQRMRMSAVRHQFCFLEIIVIFSIHTKVRDRNDIQNSPDIISLLSFKLESKLSPGPRMRAIATNHVFSSNCFAGSCSPIFRSFA